VKHLFPKCLMASCLIVAACAFIKSSNADPPMKATLQLPQTALNTFIRGVYWPWERTAPTAQNAGMDVWQFSDKVLRDLKEQSHVDVIWVVNINVKDALHLAELADKYHIGVMPVTGSIYDYRGVRSAAAARSIAEKTVSTLGNAKGIAAYVFIDEPQRGEISYLEEARAELAKLDPARPSIVVSMTWQTEAVVRQTKLPFIITDTYPYFGDNSPNGPNTPTQSRDYYSLASQRVATFGQETGKSSWMMPMVFSDIWSDWHYDKNRNAVAEPGAYLHWRMPTIGETKWQIWQAIEAGNKGVIFYVLFPTPNPRRSAQDAKDMKGYHVAKPAPDWPHFNKETSLNYGTGLLYNDGTPTPQMKAMGEVFATIEPQRELLERLQPAPPVAFANAPFHASTFQDPATGHTVIVAINDNTDSAVTGQIKVLPTIASARDLISGEVINKTNNDPKVLSTPSLKIGAGEGAILDLGKVDASLTYSEDFSIQFTAGKFSNIQKVLLPVDWGLGYSVEAKADGATGQLQYKMSQVAGDWKRMGGRLYLVYNGSGKAAQNVEVSVSSDGEKFQPLSTDEFNQPVAIPQGTTEVRFALLNATALLEGWKMIAVP